MDPAVVVALITGAVALAVAVFNAVWSYRRDMRLEQRKSELSREEAAEKARADYEYTARLGLYERFEPLLFQLLDLGDYALNRIKNLTDPDVWTKLVIAEDDHSSEGRPPMAAADYELVSTVYGLFAPLVLVRSMSRQLTLVDLSLEGRIELPYYLAIRIYGSFKDDAKLADMDPHLLYWPFHPEWRELRKRDPAIYWWQGLTMGRLEVVLDLLETSEPQSSSTRLLSFGEFERRYECILEQGEEWERKALAVASNPLVLFTPETRPVYWRLLIAQACLYQALLRILREAESRPTDRDGWMNLLRLENQSDFRWRKERTPEGISKEHSPPLEEALKAAQRYLEFDVVNPRLLSHRGLLDAAARGPG